ncbi:hypothetical protein R3W88_016550 [Solanum pinnatisectum]|uniref:Endonuclease/exonuclease/phosphatase domain-containing protein n=1 Tax=Solanum pinnatisectum TaxID=50273 RepID=A0AAV9L1W8_9SOLN|nr:hypothetical protein R3W88_016550 [Solanum pinnatisectum]
MPMGVPLSPMNHQITTTMREEESNMIDPPTRILFLKNPLTIDMPQNTERKFLFKVPHEVKKISISTLHYNSHNQSKYIAILIPTVKDKHVLEVGNKINNNTNINLEIGAHSANFMTNVHALIEWNNPTILALTETRMEDHGKILQALDFTDVIQVPVRSIEVIIEPFVVTEQEIYATIKVSSTTTKWYFSTTYAKNSYTYRKTLWESLRNIATKINSPWLVYGDFNEVTNASEKLGGKPINNTKCSSFIRCLDDMNMIDLGFTRLDRSNHDCLSLFPKSNVHQLTRTHSDHCPILLNFIKSYPNMEKVFRFKSMWIRHPDFPNIVREAWKNNSYYNIALENFLKTIKN